MLIDSRRHNGPTLQARLARSLALLVLLLAAAARPALAAPIVFVQSNSATPQSPQTTVTVSYTAAQTLGNLNVVVVGWNNSTAAVSSVTDSRGNAYAVAAAPVGRYAASVGSRSTRPDDVPELRFAARPWRDVLREVRREGLSGGSGRPGTSLEVGRRRELCGTG